MVGRELKSWIADQESPKPSCPDSLIGSTEQIQAAPDTVAAGRSCIEGFARVGDELLILLDVDNLLDPANLETVHRTGLKLAEA